MVKLKGFRFLNHLTRYVRAGPRFGIVLLSVWSLGVATHRTSSPFEQRGAGTESEKESSQEPTSATEWAVESRAACWRKIARAHLPSPSRRPLARPCAHHRRSMRIFREAVPTEHSYWNGIGAPLLC